MSKYDFLSTEKEILEFWDDNKVYEKIKERNKGKKKWTYLDGPPYTSGRMHLGTAWGKSLRDSIMRFKRMRGFDVWDRSGFDMHGLPTENKVADKHNFTRKEEIEEYGIEKFQQECEEFCVENMKIMIQDFKRIGVWMDFDNPYMPIKPEYMEGEWFLAKKAYDDGRLYEGAKVMTWCPRCATSVSKHELEYKHVTDPSIYVKFRVKDNDYLVIWTTTPWTLAFNMAVMVNPDLDYVKLKVEGEFWIVAKELAIHLMEEVFEKPYEIVEEFKGKEMEGMKYEHVFHNASDVYKENEQYAKNCTVILSSEHVGLEAGTGLVHCAPGCGPADQEVGSFYGLPAFNETDQYGVLSERMGKLSGLTAKKDDGLFQQHVENEGFLVHADRISHEYPTCWRCHGPVIFRPTKQWFFKIEDLKEKMLDFNRNIKWVPEAAFKAFNSWLENIKDNGVTRQRFWGTPVPIWKCSSCEEISVIGSIKELEERAGRLPEKFHIPWIDDITLKCPACGEEMKRIPDIFDVWIDAGSAGWNCYDYLQDEEKFKRYFPADLILEGKDQIRGWFNLLMVASTLAFDQPSFKNVYMHGFINDYRGIKMSKSLGNITDPNEIIQEHGADILRYYTISSANPGEDMNYNPEDPKAKKRNLLILWNLHKYLIDCIEVTGYHPKNLDLDKLEHEMSFEDRYILSRLNSTIEEITKLYDLYELAAVPQVFEQFYLDVSRNYVQYIREKLSIGSEDQKKIIVKVLALCMHGICRLAAPVMPFITEKMYQNLREYLGTEEISVHGSMWPGFDVSLIDKELEEDFGIVSEIIQGILRARERVQLGVRWPVPEVIIESGDKNVKDAVTNLGELIMNQVNAKDVVVTGLFEKATVAYKADYKQIGELCGKDTPNVIMRLAETSPDSIESNLQTQGFHKISSGGNEYEIRSEHLIKETTVPEGYHMEQFSSGRLFLHHVLDEALENEGYARELVRRIQDSRKKAGLTKSDKIRFYVVSHISRVFRKWEEEIKEKVSATDIDFVSERPEETFKNEYKVKIRDKEIVILFNS